jgi:hypothetical protein
VTDERRDIPREAATREDPAHRRFPPPLPALDSKVRREAVLEEDELSSRPQDSSNPSNGLLDTGDGTQRESADDRIDSGIFQRYAFSREVQEIDL